jgi:hypothetical protein
MGDRSSYFLAADAYQMLASELAAFRQLSYTELVQLVGPPHVRTVRSGDSTEYAIQITVRVLSTDDILVDGWIAVDDCGPMRRLDDQFVVPKPDCRGTE